jgi:hypothetical protein
MRRHRRNLPKTPHRKRGRSLEQGLVDVVITSDEHSAAPGEGFDLGEFGSSDAALVNLAMRANGIDPATAGARQQLRRLLSKKLRDLRRSPLGRKPDDLRLAVDMALAGATDDQTAPAAAQAILTRRGHFLGIESLTQKIRRQRRKEKSGRGGRK